MALKRKTENDQEENGFVRLLGVMRAGKVAQCIKHGTRLWQPKLDTTEPMSEVRCGCQPDCNAAHGAAGRDRNLATPGPALRACVCLGLTPKVTLTVHWHKHT